MLGKTAGGLFWMFRYLERCESTARLIEAGWRMALTRSAGADGEWDSVLTTVGAKNAYLAKHDDFSTPHVINFLLRDKDYAGSILSMVKNARDNARTVRTALSSEVWEATNDCWMQLRAELARPVTERDLATILTAIKNRAAVVRGALHSTMLQNDIYNFAQIGTFLERADNTARILDVKYYVLLPSAVHIGSSLDNAQWETILRSVSAYRSYRWLYPGQISPRGIADFMILDKRMPRSISFCGDKIIENLAALEKQYGQKNPSSDKVAALFADTSQRSIEQIFESGLHEFLVDKISGFADIANQVETDYRFYG